MNFTLQKYNTNQHLTVELLFYKVLMKEGKKKKQKQNLKTKK